MLVSKLPTPSPVSEIKRQLPVWYLTIFPDQPSADSHQDGDKSFLNSRIMLDSVNTNLDDDYIDLLVNYSLFD